MTMAMVGELRGRELMESRYGRLGSGVQRVSIGGEELQIAELLMRMGLDFDDARPIDIVSLSANQFAIRYYDAQDQRIVAHEFDAQLNFLGEIRAHIAEWIGEEAYFSLFSGH